MSVLALPHAPADLGALAVAYLVGAIPFGLLLLRVLKGVDIRAVGSGNIGATNALRAGGRGLGLGVFALDFLKGWVAPALIAPGLGSDDPAGRGVLAVACGAAAVLGHCFPVWLRFRGGKGVATACGALVALDPLVFLAGGVVWIATVALTRYVGLASMLMGVAFLAAAWLRHGSQRPELSIGTAMLLVLILARHRSNISRMLQGTEPRLFAGRAERGAGRSR